MEKFQPPKTCPVCNHPTEMDGPFLTCQNDECPALYLGNLYKWIDGLEIMNIGKSIIEKLYLSGCIKNPADFYKLEINDIATLEGLGEKSAIKILKHLHEKMELTLPELIGNLNMKNFAKSRVEMLVEAGYDTLDKILNISTEQLVKIKGIEQKTARSILDGLMAKKSTIERLLKNGIKIKQVKKEQTILKSSKLAGKSYLFTGAIQRTDKNGNRYTRDDMENFVKENNGIVANSVNKNLDYLVTSDFNSNSSKMKKAKEINIGIISEDDFFNKLR